MIDNDLDDMLQLIYLLVLCYHCARVVESNKKVRNVVKTTTPTLLITFDWAPADVVGIQECANSTRSALKHIQTGKSHIQTHTFQQMKSRENLYKNTLIHVHVHVVLIVLMSCHFTIRYGKNILVKQTTTPSDGHNNNSWQI